MFDGTSNSEIPLLVMLSADQRTIHATLAAMHDELAMMYLAAIVELQGENPDRLALAAHALRELMEKIPRYSAAPVREDASQQKGRTTLTHKVRTLEEAWLSAKRSTHLRQNPWSGELDRVMCNFFAQLDSFFDQVHKDNPARTEADRAAMQRIDPTMAGLPGDLEKRRVAEWQRCREYFEGVAHHNPSRSLAELQQMLERFEQMLLDMLTPKTFDTFAQLDAIIQEGEGNA